MLEQLENMWSKWVIQVSRVQGNGFRTFGEFCFDHFLTSKRPNIFRKMDLRWLLWPKCQVKKVSYIDPIVMRFSLKSELFIEEFQQKNVFFI